MIEINHLKTHFDFNRRRSCSSSLIKQNRNAFDLLLFEQQLRQNNNSFVDNRSSYQQQFNRNFFHRKFITLMTRKSKKIIFLIRKTIKKIIIITRIKMISRTNISIKTTSIRIIITGNNNCLSKKHKIISSTHRRSRFVFSFAIVAISNFTSTINYIDISKFVNRNLFLFFVIKMNQ